MGSLLILSLMCVPVFLYCILIVSLGIGVIDQMHHLQILLPRIMPIPTHIVWRIPRYLTHYDNPMA